MQTNAATANLEKAQDFVTKVQVCQTKLFSILCQFESYFHTKINILNNIFTKKHGEDQKNLHSLCRDILTHSLPDQKTF